LFRTQAALGVVTIAAPGLTSFATTGVAQLAGLAALTIFG
jgi:hypothetical protein